MNSRNPKAVPMLMTGAIILGALMFVMGRSTAPKIHDSSAPTAAGKEDSHKEEEDKEQGEEHESGEDNGKIVFSAEALESSGVETAPVALRPQIAGLPFNGSLEASPDNVARVASVVPGRITRIYTSLGAQVTKGQMLALIESRNVGEAQAAYTQAVARLQNARSNFNVVLSQARAGVFSRGPVEIARRAQVDAAADVRAGETAVRQASVALNSANRLAGIGSFARPSLDAAKGQYAAALESSQTAAATQANAAASVQSAQAELERRRQIAAGGGYSSRPTEEARRVLVAAQSARATAQSEVSATRANLGRAKSLSSEGLVSTRDVEAAQSAYDTATARLETTQADERSASQELERQQKLAASNIAGLAEVQDAQAKLASAQADARTRRAEAQRAKEGLHLAELALKREQAVFSGNIANQREISTARAALENARNSLEKARQTFAVNDAALKREVQIFRKNLNNTAQVQSAHSSLVAAQADLSAAQSTLRLLKSSADGSAVVPIRAPLSGIIQARDVAQGEVVDADKNLFTIVNLNTVRVAIFLPEADMASVRVGSTVNVRIDAFPKQSFSGKIRLISSQVDPKDRTLEAQAVLANPGGLRPGMFARGTIATGSSKLAIMVPSESVQDMEGKPTVFISGEKGGEFEAREVEVGEDEGRMVVIRSGLKPGEKIVVKGAFMVKAQAMKSELGDDDD